MSGINLIGEGILLGIEFGEREPPVVQALEYEAEFGTGKAFRDTTSEGMFFSPVWDRLRRSRAGG